MNTGVSQVTMSNVDISSVLENAREVMYGGCSDKSDQCSIEHVVEIMSKMDSRLSQIEMYVRKIEDVQSCLTSLTTKVNTLETNVKLVHASNIELEGSLQGISNLYDGVASSCDIYLKNHLQLPQLVMTTRTVERKLNYSVKTTRSERHRNRLAMSLNEK